MAKKVIYYEDPLNDDFAGNNIHTKQIPSDYHFTVSNSIWSILEFIVYRLIATPLVWLIGKLFYGLRIKHRKVLQQLRETGFYLYGNHTQTIMDAYTPSLCVFPHKAHIITSPDAVSIPGIRPLVRMLGAIPIPSTIKGYARYLSALDKHISRKRVVTIYPEAHIWPWYTGIRPFPDSSFAYPLRQNVPVVAFVTTFRQRKLFKHLWPCLTVTLSDPFYPDASLPPREARRALRNQVYQFMCSIAENPDNYVYVEYQRRDPESSIPKRLNAVNM